MIGVLLIAASLAVVGYNMYDSNRARLESAAVTDKLVNMIDDPSYSADAADARQMPVLYIDGEPFIGYLDIPDLGITLPVAAELTDAKLKKTPCLYFGTLYQNDMVIGGHNYVSHFGRLGRLSVGAQISFTDAEGNVYSYTLDRVRTVGETDGEALLQQDGWDLTLFTCTYSGKARYAYRFILNK